MVSKNIGIGWDIGIKNLAYCILDCHLNPPEPNQPNQPNQQSHPNQSECILFNNTYYAINYWKDISLVSQIESNLQDSGEVSHINTTLKCSVPKNDKVGAPVCGNNAIYCHEELNSDGTYKGYCKTHFKKSGIARMPDLTAKKCYMENCGGKTAQVLKSHIYTGYCKKHITEMINTKVKQAADFLKINRAKTTSKIDINHLGIALFQELDKIKTHILEPNIILLENQPVLKNPTMKSMQMFLYSYYLIRHLDIARGNAKDIANGNSNCLEGKNLQCYTASKKLDLIKFFPRVEQTRIEGVLAQVKSGYQKNKKMSIMMVEYLLKGNTKWLEFFNKHPKQDDLADSLLMTLHYFEKKNLEKLKKDNLKEEKKQEKEQTKGNTKVKGSAKGKVKDRTEDNTDNSFEEAKANQLDWMLEKLLRDE